MEEQSANARFLVPQSANALGKVISFRLQQIKQSKISPPTPAFSFTFRFVFDAFRQTYKPRDF